MSDPGRVASTPLWPMVAALVLTGCNSSGGDAIDLSATGCFGGVVPFLVVYVWGTGIVAMIIGLMVVRALRWRRLARAADASLKPDAPLREGPAVLSGSVAPEETGAAVRVEVHLQGSEEKDSSGDWTHRWDEKDRQIRVRPFLMRLRSGERVRVEPTREVQFMDALDGVVWVNRAARILVAELTPGESLIAMGQLERRPRPDGYRGSADQWVLVEPRKGGMMLSTEPLGERFRSRAVGAVAATVFTLIGWVALHGVTIGYHLRVFQGQTVVGQYVSHRAWTTRDSDDDVQHHRQLTVRLPDGSTFGEEITTVGPVGDAYVRLVPGFRGGTSFGRTATLHLVLILAHLAYPIFALLVFRWLTPKRWYEGRSQESVGLGRLQDPPQRRR